MTNNTGVGARALQNSTKGSLNTGTGRQVVYGNDSGSFDGQWLVWLVIRLAPTTRPREHSASSLTLRATTIPPWESSSSLRTRRAPTIRRLDKDALGRGSFRFLRRNTSNPEQPTATSSANVCSTFRNKLPQTSFSSIPQLAVKVERGNWCSCKFIPG